jgi:transcriptional regulator with XRE-family HTH domain
MSFSNKLKDLRKKNGLTQEELGSLIGMSNRAISYYENEEHGKRTPPDNVLEKISTVFGVSMDYFNEADVEADGRNEIKRYKTLTNAIIEELENYGASYAEAFEALEGAKRQLNHRLESIKIAEEV